jgi:putative tricarboxylic transport membrane protein
MEFIAGWHTLLQGDVLLMLFLGVLVGIMLGALPGLDATVGVSLLLPITYALDPLNALVFFTSLYSAAVFGGSITAILFRIPGSTEAIMTALEGHHFTARGQAELALGIAVACSAIGGFIACIGLYLATPFLAATALEFGPSEYFALGVLGLSCISTISGSSQLKGLAAALIGLLLGTVGLDALTGAKRFDFGTTVLLTGIPLVPACIGLFAASEVLRRILERDTELVKRAPGADRQRIGVALPRIADFVRFRWVILRSSLLGLFIGILPGAGATTAAILSYSVQSKLSKNPERFGHGTDEGIAAPESANNAAAVGAMIPLLSLGIPGSATTAVMIGAFMIHNLQPGPMLFVREPELVYGLFASMTVANVVILALAFIMVRLFARLALLPYPVLATAILSVCVIGSLAYGNTDAAMLMLVFACIGLALEAAGYPLAPVVLGLVLAPIIEISFRRAMIMEGSDVVAVLTQPLAAAILLLALGFLFGPWVMRGIAAVRSSRTAAAEPMARKGDWE